MKLLHKLIAFTLFSIFLTACDKPTEQVLNKEPVITAADEFKIYKEWQRTQEQLLSEAMIKAMEEGKSNDNAIAQAIGNQINHIRETANTLQIKDPEILALKDKAVEVMNLGVQMLKASELAGTDLEKQRELIQLTQQLQKVAEEGQAMEMALKEKYDPQPAIQEPTPTEAK